MLPIQQVQAAAHLQFRGALVARHTARFDRILKEARHQLRNVGAAQRQVLLHIQSWS